MYVSKYSYSNVGADPGVGPKSGRTRRCAPTIILSSSSLNPLEPYRDPYDRKNLSTSWIIVW